MIHDPAIDESIVGKIVDEFIERLDQGEHPSVDEYAKRHPEIAEQLKEVLATVELMQHGLDEHLGGETPESATDKTPRLSGALGDFRIARQIGRGGMGVVYEAQQISLERRVALKVLPFASVLDPKNLQRFKNEALAAAALEHPNIVPVYGVGCERGVHHYAMRYIEGSSLAEVIAELRRTAAVDEASADVPPSLSGVALSLLSDQPGGSHNESAALQPTIVVGKGDTAVASERGEAGHGAATSALTSNRSTKTSAYFRSVARLGHRVAEALQYAHENGVVHRDIKPANLMLDSKGKVWVTDFGLAHIETDNSLTMSGDLLGTLRYMSPEQALAKRVVIDHRTDIYSLGVTLYELLTLQPAFAETDRQQLLHRIAFEEPKRPRQITPQIPTDLETILLKAIAKNPHERYGTAEELADDMNRHLKNEPIRARPPTLLQRATKWSLRHTALVWSTIAILLITTIAMSVSSLLVWRQNRKVEAAFQRELMLTEELRKEREQLEKKSTALEQQVQRTESERSRAESQRERAEANLKLALEAVDEIYLRVTKERAADDDVPSPEKEEEALLHRTLEFYERFAESNQSSSSTRTQVKEIYNKVLTMRSELVKSKAHVVGFRRAFATATLGLADLLANEGRIIEATDGYREALAIREELVEIFPAVAEYRAELVSGHIALAKTLDKSQQHDTAATHRQHAERLNQALASTAPLGTVAIDDFETTDGLILAGAASVANQKLELCSDSSRGGAWLDDKQLVAFGFESQFAFRMFGRGNGVALVIENSGPFAQIGGGRIPYHIRNSVAVEFDTGMNPADLSVDHISVNTNGTEVNSTSLDYSLGVVPCPIDLNDEKIHHARIRYVPGELQVYLDRNPEPVLQVALELSNLLGLDRGRARVGLFGGAVGDATQEIHSWQFHSLADDQVTDSFALAPYSDADVIGKPSTIDTINGTIVLDSASESDHTNVTMVADALSLGDRLRLLPNTKGARGACWVTAKRLVAEGFETSFDFRILGEGNGFAFAIQNHDLVVTKVGWAFEFPNCVAIEFDTWVNNRYEDVNDNHLSVQTNGPATNSPHHYYALAASTPPFDLNDGSTHRARIRYVPGQLEIFLDDAAKPVVQCRLDLESQIALDEGRAWIGFVGTNGTGDRIQTQDILAWDFQAFAPGDGTDTSASSFRWDSSEHPLSMMKPKRGDTTQAGTEQAAAAKFNPLGAEDLAFFGKALAFYQSVGEFNNEPKSQIEIGKAYWRASEVLQVSGQEEEAEKSRQTALRLWDKWWDRSLEDREVRKLLMGTDDRSVVSIERLLQCYEAAVRENPKDISRLTRLGRTYREKKEFDKAIACYDRAIELDPKYSNAYFSRAYTYSVQGQRDKALADYTRAIELEPTKTAYNNRGINLRNRKKFDEALADYNKAIELDPDYEPAYRNRGRVYAELKEFDRAIADYSKAIELNSADIPAYFYRAVAYHAINRREAALADYDKAIELAPRAPEAYNNRGIVHSRLERFEDALADYRKAIKFGGGKNRAPFMNRGRLYRRLRRFDEAVVDFTKAIEVDPDDAETYYERAVTYKRLKQFDKALDDYEMHIKACGPDSAGSHNNVAWRLARVPQQSESLLAYAVQCAERAVELEPDKGAYHNTVGVAYYRAGDWNAAIEALQKSVDLGNAESVAFDFFFLAMAHWKLGQMQIARQEFDKAVQWMDEHKPNNGELKRFRAEAEQLLGIEEPPENLKSDISKQ